MRTGQLVAAVRHNTVIKQLIHTIGTRQLAEHDEARAHGTDGDVWPRQGDRAVLGHPHRLITITDAIAIKTIKLNLILTTLIKTGFSSTIFL